MRVFNRLSTALACTCTMVLTSSAISLLDYTFPTSTTQQAYLNGTFNALDSSGDSTQVGYNLGGSGTYWLALRSLPFSYNISGAASANNSRSTVEGADTENSFDVNAATNLDKYFSTEAKTFFYGGASIDYRKLAGQDKADDPRVDVEAGLGYGRTINATVLKMAVRMDEDFQKYGVTMAGMSDEALLQLAAIIDRQDEFRSTYGPVEYRKYWYGEMEKVLLAAGVLARESLGAMGVLRIQEVIDEPTAQRWHGWSARVGVGDRISDYDGSSGDPSLVARLENHLPIGMVLQVSNRASVSAVFSTDMVYNLQENFRVDYEISNRIDWYNGITVNYDMPTATDAENQLNAIFNSTFIYYLENRLSFNPELQYRYTDDGISDAAWDWAILGGITYRLK